MVQAGWPVLVEKLFKKIPDLTPLKPVLRDLTIVKCINLMTKTETKV